MRFWKLNSREFFNSVAEKWDRTVNHDERKIRSILDMVHIKEGHKVLDVGTGTGVMIPFLHSYTGNTGKIIAVDVAEKMIEVARNKFNFENVEFIAGDVLKIELPENYFDCIMCYSMFPHFDDKKAAVEKLARYLKKDGKFVICHSQSRETINNLHKEVSEVVKNDRLPPADKIKEYYNNAAIETISVVDNENMFVVIGSRI
jgi:demethylmenaquinone methyltransferase/2-methoxy-6-polyprenyl-1,4-benzoquinol methylase